MSKPKAYVDTTRENHYVIYVDKKGKKEVNFLIGKNNTLENVVKVLEAQGWEVVLEW